MQHSRYDVRDTLGTRFENKDHFARDNPIEHQDITYTKREHEFMTDLHTDKQDDPITERVDITSNNFYAHPKYLRSHSKNAFRNSARVMGSDYQDNEAFEKADAEADKQLYRSTMTKSHQCFFRNSAMSQTTGNSFYQRPNTQSFKDIKQIALEK